MTTPLSPDHETLQRASGLLDPPNPDTDGSRRRPSWPGPSWSPWAIAGALIVVAFVGVLVGRTTAPNGGSSRPAESASSPHLAAEVLAADSPLADIEGTSSQDLPPGPDDDDERDRRDAATRWVASTGADTQAVAWPGQVLTAPDPTAGDAVAWQWETCTPTPADDEADETETDEPLELECEPVGDATDHTWTSPPTPTPRLVRVIVTVDLGDGVHAQAASAPVTALAWPDGLAPGESPLEDDDD